MTGSQQRGKPHPRVEPRVEPPVGAEGAAGPRGAGAAGQLSLLQPERAVLPARRDVALSVDAGGARAQRDGIDAGARRQRGGPVPRHPRGETAPGAALEIDLRVAGEMAEERRQLQGRDVEGGVNGAARLEGAVGRAGDPALGEVEIRLEAPAVHARGEPARAEGEAGRSRVLHLRAGERLEGTALHRRLRAQRQRAVEGQTLGEAGDLREREGPGRQFRATRAGERPLTVGAQGRSQDARGEAIEAHRLTLKAGGRVNALDGDPGDGETVGGDPRLGVRLAQRAPDHGRGRGRPAGVAPAERRAEPLGASGGPRVQRHPAVEVDAPGDLAGQTGKDDVALGDTHHAVGQLEIGVARARAQPGQRAWQPDPIAVDPGPRPRSGDRSRAAGQLGLGPQATVEPGRRGQSRQPSVELDRDERSRPGVPHDSAGRDRAGGPREAGGLERHTLAVDARHEGRGAGPRGAGDDQGHRLKRQAALQIAGSVGGNGQVGARRDHPAQHRRLAGRRRTGQRREIEGRQHHARGQRLARRQLAPHRHLELTLRELQ